MSARKSSFIKQAAIMAFAALFVRFIGFLYRLPLTGLIGDEGNGIYSAGYQLYMFFLILSSAGLPAAISKMVSERLARKEYKNAYRVFRVSLLFSMIAGLFCAVLLFWGAQWFAEMLKSPESALAIQTLAPTVLIVAVMAVFRGYFQGMNNTLPTAISQIVEQVINAVSSVYLAYIFLEQGGLAWGVAGGTAGTGLGALFGFLAIVGIYWILKPVLDQRMRTNRTGGKRESDRKILYELVMTAFPIIVGTGIFSVANLIDLKMVNGLLLQSGAFSPSEVNALYGQLTGKYVVLSTLPVSISTALATVVVPNIAASLLLEDRADTNRKINLALKLTMLISIPAAVGLGVLGDPILLLLFPKYSGGGILLQAGAVSVVFLALAQICTGILQGAGYVKVPAMAALCGGLVKIPINWLLISMPSVNVVGAVISTIACYLVASMIDLGYLITVVKVRVNLLDCLVKPAVAAGVMGLACFVFYHALFMVIPNNTVACLVSIVLGMGVYFLYMLVIKGIVREDIVLLPKGKEILKLLEGWRLID